MFVFQLLIINVVLGVFNLLPVPQFDGAHFIMHLALKFKINSVAEFFYKNERYGMIIVLIILMTPMKDYLLFMPVQTILGLLLSH
jgi:Zn-dependent protease